MNESGLGELLLSYSRNSSVLSGHVLSYAQINGVETYRHNQYYWSNALLIAFQHYNFGMQ